MRAKITPTLWFDDRAQQAAEFYVSVFEHSRVVEVTHYTGAGPRPAGTVMTVDFDLGGHRFTAINGGPEFTFDEAISFRIDCADQDEVDYFWARLSEGGQQGPCGWLKDGFGLSWQVVPSALAELIADPDPQRVERTVRAMLDMGKLDVAALREAAAGTAPT